MGKIETILHSESGVSRRGYERRKADLQTTCGLLVEALILHGQNSYISAYVQSGYLAAIPVSDQLLIFYTLAVWRDTPKATSETVWENVWKL